MQPNKPTPSRLELVKAGKLEERRHDRSAHVAEEVEEEVLVEKIEDSFKLSPEVIAIALMVIVLIVLTLTGM